MRDGKRSADKMMDPDRLALERLQLQADPKSRHGRLVVDSLSPSLHPLRFAGFAPQAVWKLDDEIVDAMAVVFALAVSCCASRMRSAFGDAVWQPAAQWRSTLALRRGCQTMRPQ
ncbi:hypothetical protein [Ralstonia solanacearum]|uniref:hypothetical protein n=2 Tax=Ralstonia solanacearum TaxID=305 RepID=UPI000A7AC75C|nr:hypothetical protein [Ralstonia solanacearum]